jgi:hypothetical protein
LADAKLHLQARQKQVFLIADIFAEQLHDAVQQPLALG